MTSQVKAASAAILPLRPIHPTHWKAQIGGLKFPMGADIVGRRKRDIAPLLTRAIFNLR